MRECRIPDDRLFDFVDGIALDLESHVDSCEHCQEFLAELWIGELATDLSQSVLRQIRFDEFLHELGQLTLEVAAAFGRAVVAYGPAVDEKVRAQGNPAMEDRATSLPATEDDEE
jgi:hypothetical protein